MSNYRCCPFDNDDDDDGDDDGDDNRNFALCKPADPTNCCKGLTIPESEMENDDDDGDDNDDNDTEDLDEVWCSAGCP